MVPNFSSALLPVDVERVPFQADPILAAIDRHEEAWSVLQVAGDGEPSLQAEVECDASRAALLGTPCATQAGAFCLLRHLRWWLDEEAPNADAYGDAWQVAQAREADLTLLLGCDGVHRIPVALPFGQLPGPSHDGMVPVVIEAAPERSPAPIRAALTPVHFARALASAGELLAALVLIGGGCVLMGLASLI